MKSKIYSIIIVVMLASTLLSFTAPGMNKERQFLSQPPIEWMKTFGGSKIDYGNSVIQTSDGGYIFTGAYDRNQWMPWLGDVWLVKTDSAGSEEWEQTHGITYNENVGRSIQQTTDGGYIITGYSGYTYHIDGYVIKTDSLGNLVWSQIYGNFNYYDNLQNGKQTTDGGYIFTGLTGSYGAGGGDAWLIKTDSNGNALWNETFGGTDLDAGNCVLQTTDGGYIITGSTVSFGTGGTTDLWLIKTDGSGNQQWSKTFGGSGEEEGTCVQQISDGYIITGYTSTYGVGNGDVWLIKTDTNGNELWSQTFGGSQMDEGFSVIQTTDGGYFITGQYTNDTTQVPDVYVIKTDTTGNEEWEQRIDNNGMEDVGNCGIQTTDLGYLVVGNTGIYSQQSVDAWLIKFQGPNSPPYMPNTPYPANNSQDVPIIVALSWVGGDPDNDTVTYDLYFGPTSTPPLLAENLITASFTLGGLAYNTTYYWKIKATDQYGAVTEGPLWSFTTMKHQLPTLEITSITGKIGVTAVITNTGVVDATNVTGNILITGGLLKLVNKSVSDNVDVLDAGDDMTLSSGLFMGLGKLTITVTAACNEVPQPVEKSQDGTILFFWVKV
jgi:hypothetical protein